MSKYTRHFGAALTLALVASACAKKDDNAALATDSAALNRDLSRAGTDTTVQPQLRDVPAATPAPTPAATAPATRRSTTASTSPSSSTRSTTTTTTRTTTPNTGTTTTSGNNVSSGATGTGNKGGAVGSIAAGSTLNLTANSKVCTNTNKVGDIVTATVANGVAGSNGAMIPSGATVRLEITELKRSENANDRIAMGFRVQSISYGGNTYAVDAGVLSTDVSKVRNEPTSKDAQKVVIGGAVGAGLGQILGKNTKSTVIGGAIGAAAGAAGAAATANYEGCVNPGASMVIKLNNSVQVKV